MNRDKRFYILMKKKKEQRKKEKRSGIKLQNNLKRKMLLKDYFSFFVAGENRVNLKEKEVEERRLILISLGMQWVH